MDMENKLAYLSPVKNVELDALLLIAAGNGNLDEVEHLLGEGADPAHRDHYGETALIKAARTGSAPCLAELIPISDPETRGVQGRAIDVAIEAGSHECSAMLAKVSRSDSLNRRHSQDRTALINAAYEGRIESVKLLLECGANPMLDDEDGRDAMMCAALAKHSHVVEALLPFCDPHRVDRHGCSALRLAMRLASSANLERSLAVFDLLLPSGNCAGRDNDGETLLMEAARINSDSVASIFIERLLALPEIKIDEKDSGGSTAMSIAASNNLTKATSLLLAAGANPNSRDLSGDLAISSAGWNNALDTLALLAVAAHGDALGEAVFHLSGMGRDKAVSVLAPRANGQFSSAQGTTALMVAALAGNTQLVAELLPISDPGMRDRRGRSASDIAKVSGHVKTQEAIDSYQLAMAERSMLEDIGLGESHGARGPMRM